MRKLYCDKCENECKELVHWTTTNLIQGESAELCDDCAELLTSWLKVNPREWVETGN